ncbi:MAG: VanZ family protein, partial [Janthinobacterium lividum]
MKTRRPPLVPPHKSWQPQPSPLARQVLICYAVLIVYGSLYPLRGWLLLGIGPFDYLFAPLPQYLTTFDVITNVLGYMPLGALFVFSVYPRWRGVAAVCLALLAGGALSACMEAIQTYLPERVASNLDLASNALGTLLGAALAAPLARPLLERGILRRLRNMWFERRSGFLLEVLLLWPLAQMFPQPFLFGSGGWPRDAWDGLDPVAREILTIWAGGLPDLISRFGDLAASSVWEAIVAGTAVLSTG